MTIRDITELLSRFPIKILSQIKKEKKKKKEKRKKKKRKRKRKKEREERQKQKSYFGLTMSTQV